MEKIQKIENSKAIIETNIEKQFCTCEKKDTSKQDASFGKKMMDALKCQYAKTFLN